jgi:hypothetical protein
VARKRASPYGSAHLASPEQDVPCLEKDARADQNCCDHREEDTGVEERDLETQRGPAAAERGEGVRGVHRGVAIR